MSTTSRIFTGSVVLRTTPHSERFEPESERECPCPESRDEEVGEGSLPAFRGGATGGAAAIKCGGSMSPNDVGDEGDFPSESVGRLGNAGKRRMGSLSGGHIEFFSR